MCSHIMTIGMGILFIIGGLSGNLVLRGTKSGPLLAVVGLGLVIYGFARIVSLSRKAQAARPAPAQTALPAAAAGEAGLAAQAIALHTQAFEAQPPAETQPPAVKPVDVIPRAAQPVETPPAPAAPEAVPLPDARGLSINEKAVLLIKVLQSRKQEVARDANSLSVENMDRYLRNFPITAAELLGVQRGLSARKEKMVAEQAEPGKIAQLEQWCALLEEFGRIRFRQLVTTATPPAR